MWRLDKWLASQTVCSRSEAGERVRHGLVTLDGLTVRDPSVKIDPEQARVTFCGKTVCFRRHLYIMMNKPAGVLCVSHDPKTQTVRDLLPDEWRRDGIFPAGRLDKDTTGFVLLTDDGDFAHALLSPKNHIPKTYLVTLDAPVTDDVLSAFETGVTLSSGESCLPAACKEENGLTVKVTLHEGKYHQIKRMFAVFGLHVLALSRISMGGVALDRSLLPGQSRCLTDGEIQQFFDRGFSDNDDS